MALVATAELVAAGPVAAFNVITLEHAEAVAEGASAAGAGVILQISQNAVRYHRGVTAIAAACRVLAAECDVPLALHLDHVEDDELFARAAAAGFSSVMYDAGALPYADNMTRTAAATAAARADGLWVEAELGFVGGKPDAPLSAHATGVRTDPDEASEFVMATGVDALAVAVGSSHAMTAQTAVLDTELIGRIARAVGVPLVLHGSSGVPDEQLRAAVRAGIAKVNIGTALNVALTGAVRDRLAADAALVDPRRYLGAGRAAMAERVAHLIGVVSG
jgi:fructose-bisphosphate aldolase class II